MINILSFTPVLPMVYVSAIEYDVKVSDGMQHFMHALNSFPNVFNTNNETIRYPSCPCEVCLVVIPSISGVNLR
jgi:hypothetical protein